MEMLPFKAVLTSVGGAVLASRCGPDESYGQWPYVLLFEGAPKACILYIQPVAECQCLPLKLLEHIFDPIVDDWCQDPMSRIASLPWEVLHSTEREAAAGVSPFCAGLIFTGQTNAMELTVGIQALFPGLKTVRVEEGLLVLLPRDREAAREWAESIVLYLSEEALADPLLLLGAEFEDMAALYSYIRTLASVGKMQYGSGTRGLHDAFEFVIEIVVRALEDRHAVKALMYMKASLSPVFEDAEQYLTFKAFINHNLNMADTAKALFVHRNTLVYRIAKLERQTGLDLRQMAHAAALRVLICME